MLVDIIFISYWEKIYLDDPRDITEGKVADILNEQILKQYVFLGDPCDPAEQYLSDFNINNAELPLSPFDEEFLYPIIDQFVALPPHRKCNNAIFFSPMHGANSIVERGGEYQHVKN